MDVKFPLPTNSTDVLRLLGEILTRSARQDFPVRSFTVDAEAGLVVVSTDDQGFTQLSAPLKDAAVSEVLETVPIVNVDYILTRVRSPFVKVAIATLELQATHKLLGYVCNNMASLQEILGLPEASASSKALRGNMLFGVPVHEDQTVGEAQLLIIGGVTDTRGINDAAKAFVLTLIHWRAQ